MTIKEDTALAVNHALSLEGRKKLAVSGVMDVVSFDEGAAALETSQGTLILRGRELHVEQLDLEAGRIRISGEVDSLVYEENRQTRESFLSRLFRCRWIRAVRGWNSSGRRCWGSGWASSTIWDGASAGKSPG